MGRALSSYSLSFIKQYKKHRTPFKFNRLWRKLSTSIDFLRNYSDTPGVNLPSLPFQSTDSEHTNPVLASVTPPHRPCLFITARDGIDKKGVKTGRNPALGVLFYQIGRIMWITGWRVNRCRGRDKARYRT